MLSVGPIICEVGKCAHGCSMESGGCKGTEWKLNYAENYLRERASVLEREGREWGFRVSVVVEQVAA
jgi:hypothetical protein